MCVFNKYIYFNEMKTGPIQVVALSEQFNYLYYSVHEYKTSFIFNMALTTEHGFCHLSFKYLQLKMPFRDGTAAQVHFVQHKSQAFISATSSVRKASLFAGYWFSISFTYTFKCLELEGIRERDCMFYNASGSRSAVTAGKAAVASRSRAGGEQRQPWEKDSPCKGLHTHHLSEDPFLFSLGPCDSP